MKRLPRAIISIILYLTILYNLERITINNVSMIDIKGFVYVLVIIFVLLILLFKFFRKQSVAMLMLFSLLMYVVGKFGVFRYWTDWTSNSAYLVITEATLIWIGVLLAHRAGIYIEDFEEAVKNISFSGIERSKEIGKTTDDIRVEMYRSRRYNHPLTMVIIEPETVPFEMDLNIAIKEVQQSVIGRYYAVNMARAIDDDLRLVDTIIDINQGKRFAILYPETTRENALPLIERVHSIAKNMGISIRSGIASFPEDAVTFDELMNKSVTNLGVTDFPKTNFKAKTEEGRD